MAVSADEGEVERDWVGVRKEGRETGDWFGRSERMVFTLGRSDGEEDEGLPSARFSQC